MSTDSLYIRWPLRTSGAIPTVSSEWAEFNRIITVHQLSSGQMCSTLRQCPTHPEIGQFHHWTNPSVDGKENVARIQVALDEALDDLANDEPITPDGGRTGVPHLDEVGHQCPIAQLSDEKSG